LRRFPQRDGQWDLATMFVYLEAALESGCSQYDTTYTYLQESSIKFNLIKPTGYAMHHQQFNP